MTGRRIRGIALTAALLAAFALALVPVALAGKPGSSGKPSGGGSTSSSLSLRLMDGATEAAHYGRITFDVSTAATDRPQVGLRCYQGSNWVFDAYVGYYPSYMFDQWFNLKSNYWVDGVWATCNARLFYFDRRGNENVLTTISFPVAP
ncbi:MAG: hypothetical protein ACRDNP_04910 [Gaiellaceae bacterium]